MNNADNALLNIPPSDAESGFATDTDDALVYDPPSDADSGFATDGGIDFDDD